MVLQVVLQRVQSLRVRRAVAGVWHREVMATESVHRSLIVERVAAGRFAAVNSRGGRIAFGTGNDEEFTPTELLLVALGGCTAIDVDILTTRRAEPDAFQLSVDADKVRDQGGNHLTNVEITYRITFPAGPEGDKARAVLPDAVKQSHDRLCTVGRTVELPTPITTRIE
jgi:putative redox protein